uniref:Trichohyalin n=1 Tax=Trypanosoma congolense (strain IL3000) TaxID=1068625 RepID=G0UW34_TRYCI|nr:conserved hypothetical protein [Trypanosoma congolense IL3000]
MMPRDLWHFMVEVLSECLDNSTAQDPDIVVEEMLLSCPTLEDRQKLLIRTTISGTLHFQRVCEGMWKGYCDYAHRSSSDGRPMYLVAYLLVFQYSTVGGHYMRELLYRSVPTTRLVEFLEYMINPKNLVEHSSKYWNRHYDSNFIRDSVCQPLQEAAEDVRKEVIEWLLSKTPGGVVQVHQKGDEVEDENERPHTTKEARSGQAVVMPPPRPMQYTLPPAEVREMLFTIPEKLPRLTNYAKPPPKVFLPRKSPTKPIGFRFMQRPPLHSVKEEPVQQEPTEEQPLRRKPPDLKAVLEKPVEVRVNAAAVRREAMTHLKKEEERLRALKEVEISLHNASEYEQWRERERRRMEEEQRNGILRRKGEIKQTEECGLKKRRAIEDKKKSQAQRFKADMDSLKEAYAAEKERHALRQHNEVLEKRHELLENRENALQRLNRKRISAAASLKKEKERLKEEAAEEDSKRREERAALIREIHLLRERARGQRTELAHHNREGRKEAPQHPWSDGMADEELRRVLAHLKAEDAQLRDERRRQHQAARQKERQKLEALSLLCERHRNNVRQAREEERAIRQAQNEKLEAAQNDMAQKKAQITCDVLRQKRSAKREEKLTLLREQHLRLNRMSLLARDAHTVEENRWKQQEMGVINRVIHSQSRKFKVETV